MKLIEQSQATESLAEYAKELQDGAVIITQSGKPVAALLSIRDVDLETISLSTNPQFLELMDQSRQRARTEGGISSEELRRKLGASATRGKLPVTPGSKRKTT